jgi:hypothetical protein
MDFGVLTECGCKVWLVHFTVGAVFDDNLDDDLDDLDADLYKWSQELPGDP